MEEVEAYENQYPISRDGVPLKVGDRVFTRPGSPERLEIVYVGRNTVVVLDENGEPSSEIARLCLVHDVSKLVLKRELCQSSLEQASRDIAQLESELNELESQIANSTKAPPC